MALNQIPFKTSRGVAAYIKANVPTGLDAAEVFPHKSSGYRMFPNVTVLVTHFYEEDDNPGCFHVNIIVSIRTACTVTPANSNPASDPAYVSEGIVGAVVDLFEQAIGQDRSALADLITAAGRTMTVDASGGLDAIQAAFAAANADMARFKVDSIVPLPNATSGVEGDAKSKCWVDDFPFELTVRAVADTEPGAPA